MRNRNWDQDFEEINQANVNRVRVNRDGQRQYDSGYRNNMGMTSFEQNMQPRHDRRNNEEGNWVNTSPNRYAARPERYDYAPSHRQARVDYDERRHLHNRYPDENATDRGFFGRMGERVGGFFQEGRERMEHMSDRFGNRQPDNHNNQQHGYNQGSHYQNHPENNRSRQEHYPNRHPRGGMEHSPYNQGNQGHVQGNRYQSDDYSARSSYRLLDSNSGYGQSGGSYASESDQ